MNEKIKNKDLSNLRFESEESPRDHEFKIIFPEFKYKKFNKSTQILATYKDIPVGYIQCFTTEYFSVVLFLPTNKTFNPFKSQIFNSLSEAYDFLEENFSDFYHEFITL